MKIVLTGALGHIGSRLIHDIRPGEFAEVVLLDNFLTARHVSLFNLPSGVPFSFHEADILTADLRPHFEGAHAVVHLAAITDPAGSLRNPAEAERVNFEGTARVAGACLETGARLISISTTSVYSSSSANMDESCTDAELQPQTPYAQSKRKAEKLLSELGEKQGLRFVTCRFGTIYGVSPGMRFHTAVNRFVWQAVMGSPLTIWRTALHQTRPYLDVSDAVRALKFIVSKDVFDNGVYNIATDNVTVERILEVVRKHVPDLKVAFVDSPVMNQLSYSVARERFEALGFDFRGSLEAGVAATVALLQNARSAGGGRP